MFPLTNTTRTAAYLGFSVSKSLERLWGQHNLRCGGRKDLRPLCIRHQAYAQSKGRGEGSNHSEFRGIRGDPVEANYGANQQDGRHEDADGSDCDCHGILTEPSYPVETVARKLFLSVC